MIKLNLEQASREFGASKDTLRRALSELGEQIGRGVTYKLKTIHRALSPEVKVQRARLLKADADIRERELAERDAVLVDMALVEKIYGEALLPIRQRFLALPSECATRANPTDPKFARDALQRWVDEALPLIREKLPKPRKR